jgi:hypothetical protein
MLGCLDREDPFDEATIQALEEPLPLERREDGRACGIPYEFRSRVAGVHPLPARSRSSREPPGQLGLGDRDRGVDPKSGTVSSGHASIMLLCSKWVAGAAAAECTGAADRIVD